MTLLINRSDVQRLLPMPKAIDVLEAAFAELDTATLQMGKVICDQKQACLNEAGDIQIPVEEGVYSSDDIHGELGSVINGTITGRENDEEITLFKSVGLAIQDISCASLVYEQAKEQGIGLEFDFTL